MRVAMVTTVKRTFDGNLTQRYAAQTGKGLERFSSPCPVEQTVRLLSEVVSQCTS